MIEYRILNTEQRHKIMNGGVFVMRVTNKTAMIRCVLAREFYALHLMGQDKVLSVKEYADEFMVGVGTVQGAIQELKAIGAVQLNPCGAQGTFLQSVDEAKLWQATEYGVLVGLLPLDSSSCVKGLATGIYQAFTQHNLPIHILFCRGSRNRVSLLQRGKCDFVVMSQLAYQYAQDNGKKIASVATIGQYANHYGIITRKDSHFDMQTTPIAYDSFSYEQTMIIRSLPRESGFIEDKLGIQLPYLVESGEVPAALVSQSSLSQHQELQYYPLGESVTQVVQDNSQAVLVVAEQSQQLASILEKAVTRQIVWDTQQKVMDNKYVPQY